MTRSSRPAAHSAMADGVRGVPEALRRKRERDKDNQRKKREREREYTTSLEQKVAELERQLARHDDSTPADLEQRHRSSVGPDEPPTFLCTTPPLISPVTSAGRPSSALVLHPSPAVNGRCEATVHPDLYPAPLADSPSDMGRSAASAFAHPDTLASPASLASHDSGATTSTEIVVSTSVLTSVLQSPEWLRLPFNTTEQYAAMASLRRGDRFAPVLAELRANPDLLAACDAEPKVLDLMFGGSSNQLANLIEEETCKDPTLPPERFAVSWLIYLYVRWLASPTAETFNRIPYHFRPTALQILKPHPPSLDLILWPQVRENFIRHGSRYDRTDVYGLLSCTCRIRGAFNGRFIVRQKDGDPQVDPDFFRRFMSLEAWGIMERFWTEYPELVHGLDPSIMIKEEHLIPR